MNGAGQIVVAGTEDQLAAFAENPPEGARAPARGRRSLPHRAHGARLSDASAALGNAITTHDPRSRLISNADGRVVHDGRDVLRRLVNQVSNPVRWDLCMQTMADLGVTAIIEIPPAGTLTGLAKRALPGCRDSGGEDPR